MVAIEASVPGAYGEKPIPSRDKNKTSGEVILGRRIICRTAKV